MVSLPINTIWTRYKKTGSRRYRNVLMEHYLPIVRYNAERIAAKLPDEIDTDDLISAGIFGLKDAIEGYDLDRGVKFETYCAPRVRGAILDELRHMDWVPRLVRSRSRKLDTAYTELRSTLGREPTEAEVAEHLDISPDKFHAFRKKSTPVGITSMDKSYRETDSSKEVTDHDTVRDRKVADPAEDARRRDLTEYICRGMTRAERLILILYYYEEMTMKEIGMTLDLSESRVSQMHSQMLERLRNRFALQGNELVLRLYTDDTESIIEAA